MLALIFLLHALALGISSLLGSDPWVGYLIVGVLLIVLGAIGGLIAMRLVKRGSPPMPQMAIEEAQLIAEVDQLLRLAERADQQDRPDGLDVPAEIARREARLAAIRQAKAEIEARAQQRQAEEQQAYEAKLASRAEREKKAGKK